RGGGDRRRRTFHSSRRPVMPELDGGGVTRVASRAVALDRRDVDTDQIIPASWLKRVERTGFGAGLFGAWREDPGFVLNHPGASEAQVLVAGANFGCGSSRAPARSALPGLVFL